MGNVDFKIKHFYSSMKTIKKLIRSSVSGNDFSYIYLNFLYPDI